MLAGAMTQPISATRGNPGTPSEDRRKGFPSPSPPCSGYQLTFPRHSFQDTAPKGAPYGALRGPERRRAAGRGPGSVQGLPAWGTWEQGPGSAF